MNEEDQPLDMLPSLEEATSPEFLQRVINRVDRRQTAAHVVNFGWSVSKAVLGEILGAMAELPEAIGKKKGKTE